MISYNKFLALESKYNLFKLKNEVNDFYWDFVRYRVSERLTNKNHSKIVILKRRVFSLKNILKIFLHLIQDFLNLSINCCYKKKYLIIHCSNYQIIKDYQNALGFNNCFLINLKNTKKKFSNEISGNIISIFSWLNFPLKSRIKKFKSYNFNNVFGLKTNSFVNKLILQHYNMENFFKIIFKIIRPKYIFFVNSGHKSIISAAKKCNIKVFEIQHAEITSRSILNNYPKRINNYKHQYISYPDAFFTFSKYWQKIHYETLKVSIGTSKKLNIKYLEKKKYKYILFAMNLNNEEYFCKIINIIMNQLDKDYKIIIKAHPQHPERIEYYKKKIKMYNHVEFINNKDIEELLKKTFLLVTSFSTSIYSALQANRIVACDNLSKPLYGKKINNFNYKNLYYFKNAQELLNVTKKKIKKDNVKFFNKFNKKKLLNFLKFY